MNGWPPRQRRDQAAPLRRATLDNGLTVLIREEHTAPLVSAWCWYHVGSKDERPGLTGVSHWVEHMNFKGTTNIPRDQVKGIIEQFGGSWNGYTWIDQTTYLETATRDALERMLFIESERMARCLYDPEDCESERTVIISELQGGENDPDQLLDQELTAAAFNAHPYKHPTIGWLSDLQTMTREDLLRLLPSLLHPEQRDARDRRRRRYGQRAETCGPSLWGDRRGGRSRSTADDRAAAGRRASSDHSQRGDRRLSEGRLSRAGGVRRRLCACAAPRCRADRRQRRQPVEQLSVAAAAAQIAPVSSARRARRRVVGVWCDAADRAAVSLHRVRHRDRRNGAGVGRSHFARRAPPGRPRRHHRPGALAGEDATAGPTGVRPGQRDERGSPAWVFRNHWRRSRLRIAPGADRRDDARRGRVPSRERCSGCRIAPSDGSFQNR